MKSHLVVKDVKAVGNKLFITYHCQGEIANYLKGTQFTAEYDCNIEDVPESLLVIPFLANVCPISWVTDSTIYCRKIDLRFYQSLQSIRESFRAMYPNIVWTGQLKPNLIINKQNDYLEQSKSALFFSGGIHSLASYIQIRDQKPLLITVSLQDLTSFHSESAPTVAQELLEFVEKRNLDLTLIHSNFRKIINYKNISLAYGALLAGHWWTHVQKGLGMIGLAAPLTQQYSLSNLYFGATNYPNPSFVKSFGSHPEIDNKIAWGSEQFHVFHHGYVLTRNDKLALICHYIKAYDVDIMFNVCSYESIGNCSRCEKCIKTILLLLVEGINPANHGFKELTTTTLESIKDEIEQGYVITPLNSSAYQDIQKYAAVKKEEIPAVALIFFDWFEKVNLEKFYRKRTQRQKWLYLQKTTKDSMKKLPEKIKMIKTLKQIDKKR